MLGVKTIGNATLIAFDGEPVLATDPWIGDEDDAYFGSWTLSNEIPAREKEEIQRTAGYARGSAGCLAKRIDAICDFDLRFPAKNNHRNS